MIVKIAKLGRFEVTRHAGYSQEKGKDYDFISVSKSTKLESGDWKTDSLIVNGSDLAALAILCEEGAKYAAKNEAETANKKLANAAKGDAANDENVPF